METNEVEKTNFCLCFLFRGTYELVPIEKRFEVSVVDYNIQNFNGDWSTQVKGPGGKGLPRETPEETARREFEEEFGVTPGNIVLVYEEHEVEHSKYAFVALGTEKGCLREDILHEREGKILGPARFEKVEVLLGTGKGRIFASRNSTFHKVALERSLLYAGKYSIPMFLNREELEDGSYCCVDLKDGTIPVYMEA